MNTSRAALASSPIWPRAWIRRTPLRWTAVAMCLLGAAALGAPQLGEFLVGALAGWLLWLAGALMFGAVLLVLPGARTFVPGLLSSLGAVAAGAFLLFAPRTGALAVTLLAAAVFIVDGAFQLALALDLRPVRVWRWVLASALASGLAAVAMATGVAGGSSQNFGAAAGVAVLSSGLALFALTMGPPKP